MNTLNMFARSNGSRNYKRREPRGDWSKQEAWMGMPDKVDFRVEG